MTEKDLEIVWTSLGKTLQQLATLDAELTVKSGQRDPEKLAWTIGMTVKNVLAQMKIYGGIPEGYRIGDITVDYPKFEPSPKFRVQVTLLQ